jgi:RNA 2',3'-cyclic 3'-phosphodiesterase
VRLFFAVWPPAATAVALHAWAETIKVPHEKNPVPAGNIHLTLAFLGEAEAARAVAAAKRVRGTRHALPIEQARYWKDSRIVWVGPRETPPALAALVHGLQLELCREEFTLERRPFAAHVTLLRRARAPRALPPLPRLEWPVDEFRLVRSRTSPAGSAYEPLERFAL